MATTKVTTPVTDFDKSTSLPGLKIPSGTNSNQPAGAAAEQGMIRNDIEETVDSSASAMTHYNGTAWQYFAATESVDYPLPTGAKVIYSASDATSYPGTGTTWFDLTSNNNDGAISGATWNSEGYFSFNGSNNYVTLPFNTTLNDFSFSTWVYPNSTSSDYHAILGKWWDGSNRSFFLSGVNQQLKVDIAYTDSNTDNLFGTLTLPDNAWSFVCVTWKNYEGLTLTVNDTTEAFSINKAIRSNTNNWYIGNQDSRITKLWDGRISKCWMYNRKLSSSEITALYNEGK